ncbi:MAG: hypothetical protein ACTS3R_01825 [Inquilinaceae bacterium]
MRYRKIQRFLSLPVFLTLAACTSSEDTLRNHGFSEAYVDGYHDGCPSGRRVAGSWFESEVQDQERFRNDHDYQVGWTYGFQTCSAEYLAIQNSIARSTHSGTIGVTGVDAKKALEGLDTSGLETLGR